MVNNLHAKVVRRWYFSGVALLSLGLLFWTVRHLSSLFVNVTGPGTVQWIWLFAFFILASQMLMAFWERPYTTTKRQQAQLDVAQVVINVPVYNEDKTSLKLCLESLLRQTRLPSIISVVDDGSTEDYTEIEKWFLLAAKKAGVEPRWDRQPNGGKRQAQGNTIRQTPDADYYLTIDSDAILDENALREGLKPFADPDVQSVAGIILVSNRTNILTKLSDLWFMVGQLVDRSAMSITGAVLVNSGCLALYRGDLLRDNLDGYLNEYFFGRKIELSDDSMLTIYALLKGKAVQQQTAFSFTMMPEQYSHHRRQYLRWMRGAFIRTWWRFKYLPMNSIAYWMHFAGWMQMALSTVTFTVLFLITPLHNPEVVPLFLLVPIIVGYGQALRYFMVQRSDMTMKEQVQTYLMMPIVVLYGFFVLRAFRYYAILTCVNTRWGTRQKVELTVAES